MQYIELSVTLHELGKKCKVNIHLHYYVITKPNSSNSLLSQRSKKLFFSLCAHSIEECFPLDRRPRNKDSERDNTSFFPPSPPPHPPGEGRNSRNFNYPTCAWSAPAKTEPFVRVGAAVGASTESAYFFCTFFNTSFLIWFKHEHVLF